MNSRHIHPVMACMLVIAQAMAGVGHVGLMVCREDTRTSRIELSISGCCGETYANTGIDIACDNGQLALPELEHCGEGDCLDEPVDADPALTRKQFHEENQDIGVPAKPVALRTTTTLAIHCSISRAGPGPINLGRGNRDALLRSVVLIV